MAAMVRSVLFLYLLFLTYVTADVNITAFDRYSTSLTDPNAANDKPKPEEEPTIIQDPNDKDLTGLLDVSDGSESIGWWKLDNPNAGVSAMHLQLMPDDKVIWFDSTSNGISEIKSDPLKCLPRVGGRPTDPQQDCTAHGVVYDVKTSTVKPLTIETSPWCSSGGLDKYGNLISTGGDKDGFKAVRVLTKGTARFRDNPNGLYSNRWYATQVELEDGSFALFGGRMAFNYELIPAENHLKFTKKMFGLPLLEETTEPDGIENNLYPFVNLLPDGNVFVFASYKSIILNPLTGETIRRLPDLPGGARNYPPSACSALLPLNLDKFNGNDYKNVPAEVIICGGNTRQAYKFADLMQPKRDYYPALKDCGRLVINKPGAKWAREDMPMRRVMGDMLILPTGDLLMINGAMAGTSAWDAAGAPNYYPIIYKIDEAPDHRFEVCTLSTIPRMYHSTSAVLPDATILVAGSNTNAYYKLKKYNDKFTYPTELRVERFWPPYLDPILTQYRVQINEAKTEKELKYGVDFVVHSNATDVKRENYMVTMYAPPFTTHGYSQNQRMLVLKIKNIVKQQITVVTPPSGKLAPPGYYILFVVHQGVPSRGMWVRIDN